MLPLFTYLLMRKYKQKGCFRWLSYGVNSRRQCRIL